MPTGAHYHADRRRAWLVGAFSVAVSFFCLVLLTAAIGEDAGFNLLGFDVPGVAWMVIWGLMAAVAGIAAVRSFRTALDRRPSLVLDDTGITYRLEITGERHIPWPSVRSVARTQVNRRMEVVRVRRSDGGRTDLRTDLLLRADPEELVALIRERSGSPPGD